MSHRLRDYDSYGNRGPHNRMGPDWSQKHTAMRRRKARRPRKT